ncbi:uncharacterized protein [Periplaneta americana]|uniref:uncharacterized protein n=1 Tax=Periplaneta americana TaxID=6978 RepID=UPI0037E99ED4
MIPRHLLVLCLSLASFCHARSTVLKPTRFEQEYKAPEFWWDLTFNKSAPITNVLNPPSKNLESGDRWRWSLNWAQGTSNVWIADGQEIWKAWTWEATRDHDLTGGGIIKVIDDDPKSLAGVNWLRDGRTGEITWNCVVEGKVSEPLTWSEWQIFTDENSTSTISFIKDKKRWGFQINDEMVMSKHCAAGSPVVGKRYCFANGKEIQSSVKIDPFTKISSNRRKRSPQFFEKVKETFKSWVQKIKDFFGGGDQQDGEGGKKCNTFIDLMVKLVNMIFGRRGGGGDSPPPYPPSEGGNNDDPPPPESGDTDSGGDPPGGADTPPADAEEIDPVQNESVRDWE